jgi:predicted anti-sigma-YlaC factor YlaD
MKTCPESARLQDLLDGELAAAEEQRVREHAAGCATCTAELTLYARVFESLGRAPLYDPGPALTERVLARVLPARARRRLVAALGWAYGAAFAACIAGLGVWIVRPESQALLHGLSVGALRRLVQTTLFAFDAVAFGLLRLVRGWGLVRSVAAWLAPLARALSALLAEPAVWATLWAAVAACGILLWWMRPRGEQLAKEVRHVGVLWF